MIEKRRQSTCRSLLSLTVLLLSMTGCDHSQINRPDPSTQGTEVLLEVTTIASPSSYPYGEILDIRLYNTKQVDFDFYRSNTPDRLGVSLVFERKQTRLTHEDFATVTSLLKQPDLSAAEDYYAPRRISPTSIDSHVRKVIKLRINQQEKEIILEENDSRIYLSEKPDYLPAYVKLKRNLYPKSLVALLETVDRINRKLRAEIDPQSR